MELIARTQRTPTTLCAHSGHLEFNDALGEGGPKVLGGRKRLWMDGRKSVDGQPATQASCSP